MKNLHAVLDAKSSVSSPLVAAAGSALSKSGPWRSPEVWATSGRHFGAMSIFGLSNKKLINKKPRAGQVPFKKSLIGAESLDFRARFWKT